MPLLEALGARLHVLRLVKYFGSCPSPETLGHVMQLCPNAKFHLSLWRNAPYVMRFVGGRLRRANIQDVEVDETFRPVADSLVHLEECTLRGITVSATFFEHFFASPKRNLRRLVLNIPILRDMQKTNLLNIVA